MTIILQDRKGQLCKLLHVTCRTVTWQQSLSSPRSESSTVDWCFLKVVLPHNKPTDTAPRDAFD